MTESHSSPQGETSALLPFKDFQAACLGVLEYLRSRIDFRLWMVTRTEGDDWIILAASDKTNHVKAGSVFRWQDSFCYQMVAGRGPRFVADTRSVDIYRNAPIARQMRIGAYIGVPIMRADGQLFGTLCGIDPEPSQLDLQTHQPVIELLSRQLATLFELENQFEREQRLRERIETEAMYDELTNVYNRRGWERLIEKEEQRCKRYGHPAGLLVVDLDNLKMVNDSEGHNSGDKLLKTAAGILRRSSRTSDIIARIGGDEFGVLCVEATPQQTEMLSSRIQLALARAGIHASIGWASRHGDVNINQAITRADRLMYTNKRLRKEFESAGDTGEQSIDDAG